MTTATATTEVAAIGALLDRAVQRLDEAAMYLNDIVIGEYEGSDNTSAFTCEDALQLLGKHARVARALKWASAEAANSEEPLHFAYQLAEEAKGR